MLVYLLCMWSAELGVSISSRRLRYYSNFRLTNAFSLSQLVTKSFIYGNNMTRKFWKVNLAKHQESVAKPQSVKLYFKV